MTQKQDCWSVGHFPRVLGELERLPKENCKILIPVKGRHTGAKRTLSAKMSFNSYFLRLSCQILSSKAPVSRKLLAVGRDACDSATVRHTEHTVEKHAMLWERGDLPLQGSQSWFLLTILLS